MALLTSIETTTVTNESFTQVCIYYKEFLKTAGWVVVGSAQSTADASGGMHYDGGATDRIGTDPANFTSSGWFVMESPHASQDDRIQLKFYRTSISYQYGCFAWTPTAKSGERYESPDATLPTSDYEKILISNTEVIDAGFNSRLHMIAEDSAPYGVALLNTTPKNSLIDGFSFSLIPLNLDSPKTSGGKPYVLFTGVYNYGSYYYPSIREDDDIMGSARCSAEPYNPPKQPKMSPGCTLSSEDTVFIPRGVGQDPDGYSMSFPVTFIGYEQYFGISDFIQWNGKFRERLETFNDGSGPRTRISFGDVSFPWDGVTIPIV